MSFETSFLKSNLFSNENTPKHIQSDENQQQSQDQVNNINLVSSNVKSKLKNMEKNYFLLQSIIQELNKQCNKSNNKQIQHLEMNDYSRGDAQKINHNQNIMQDLNDLNEQLQEQQENSNSINEIRKLSSQKNILIFEPNNEDSQPKKVFFQKNDQQKNCLENKNDYGNIIKNERVFYNLQQQGNSLERNQQYQTMPYQFEEEYKDSYYQQGQDGTISRIKGYQSKIEEKKQSKYQLQQYQIVSCEQLDKQQINDTPDLQQNINNSDIKNINKQKLLSFGQNTLKTENNDSYNQCKSYLNQNINDDYINSQYKLQIQQNHSDNDKVIDSEYERSIQFDEMFEFLTICNKTYSEFIDKNGSKKLIKIEQNDINKSQINNKIYETSSKRKQRIYKISKLIYTDRYNLMNVFKGYFINDISGKSIIQNCVFKIFQEKEHESFQQEIYIYQQLKNTCNIVKKIDHMKVGNLYILVLEMGKKTLLEILQMFQLNKNKKKFTLEILLQMISDLLDGVIWIRNNQIVHQDIKPQNIVLTENNNYALIDFECSSQKQGFFEKRGYTEKYASPEQKDFDAKIDYKSDIYCLGKTFQEIIEVFLKVNPLRSVAARQLVEGFNNIIKNHMIEDDIQKRLECHEIHKLFFDQINYFEYLNFNLVYKNNKIEQIQQTLKNVQNKDEYTNQIHLYYNTLNLDILKLNIQNLQNLTKQYDNDTVIQQNNTILLSISEQSTILGNMYKNRQDFYSAYQFYMESYNASLNLIDEFDPNVAQSLVNINSCYLMFEDKKRNIGQLLCNVNNSQAQIDFVDIKEKESSIKIQNQNSYQDQNQFPNPNQYQNQNQNQNQYQNQNQGDSQFYKSECHNYMNDNNFHLSRGNQQNYFFESKN